MNAVLNSPEYRIRPMQGRDLSQVLEIERQAYCFPWSERVFRDCLRVGYLCRVMEHDRRIEAYGIMSFGAGDCHILNICVRLAAQHQGLGRKMMESLIRGARTLECGQMFLEVRPSNQPAVNLYHKLGFKEVGRRKGYYPATRGREDALVLKRPL